MAFTLNYNNSIFGIINNKLKELKTILSGSVDITSEEFKFPEIIIVGDEKNGKSSLLENITKCKIFPKDRGYCTKCPVRFILRNSKDTSFSIDGKECSSEGEVCKLVEEKFGDEISDKEIVVEYSSPENHNFQFVDLPGIKAFPASASEATKSVTDKYLGNKNNVVVFAYAATTSSEANCSTFGLIKKHDRQKDTILVMTMLDKLGDVDDIEYAASQKFDEFENIFYVISNGKDEDKWFNLHGINGNVTAQKLLIYTEKLFSSYVNNNWYKNIIANLEKQKISINDEIKELGYFDVHEKYLYTSTIHYILYTSYKNISFTKEYLDNYHELSIIKEIGFIDYAKDKDHEDPGIFDYVDCEYDEDDEYPDYCYEDIEDSMASKVTPKYKDAVDVTIKKVIKKIYKNFVKHLDYFMEHMELKPDLISDYYDYSNDSNYKMRKKVSLVIDGSSEDVDPKDYGKNENYEFTYDDEYRYDESRLRHFNQKFKMSNSNYLYLNSQYLVNKSSVNKFKFHSDSLEMYKKDFEKNFNESLECFKTDKAYNLVINNLLEKKLMYENCVCNDNSCEHEYKKVVSHLDNIFKNRCNIEDIKDYVLSPNKDVVEKRKLLQEKIDEIDLKISKLSKA